MHFVIYTFFLLHGLLYVPSYADILAAAHTASELEPKAELEPEHDIFGRFFCFVVPNAMLTKYECWYIYIKLHV